jgi:large subunit ribosomal protein L17
MRHNKSFNHLGRQAGHRSAMLANMASSLILHKRINTTVAKAKALKMYVEPLITKSKVDSTHSRRVVFSYLQNKDSVSELFRDIAVKVANRPGGYTRILKTGNRIGDNAEMCIIELVDYNEIYTQERNTTEKPAAKRRRGTKKKSSDEAAPVAKATKEVDAVKETKTAPVAPVTDATEVSSPAADEAQSDENKVE